METNKDTPNLTVLAPEILVPPEIVLGEFEKFSAEFTPDVRIFSDLCLTLLPIFQGGKNVKIFHEWQKNATKYVLRQMMPTIRSREIDGAFEFEASPALLGKLSGHILALVLSICDGTASLPKLPEGEREQFKTAVQAFWTNMWSIGGTEQLKNANVVKYKLADVIEFSKSFNKALSCTVDQSGILFSGQGDWQLLGFLIIHADKVMEFKNTTELHEFLVRRFGENRTGNLERIRNICTKIGLRFSDKGGRPKKPATK
jgi:hypothetical protein